ncbi:hypothetical protein VTN77DRAFT_9626 [Rasamsonia byssochlamydoides]|uniref:uncharacterized protein n=1 Tax=Rasamsonia byssochlamydoides TaxID=89139 RepID=UPI003743ECBD
MTFDARRCDQQIHYNQFSFLEKDTPEGRSGLVSWAAGLSRAAHLFAYIHVQDTMDAILARKSSRAPFVLILESPLLFRSSPIDQQTTGWQTGLMVNVENPMSTSSTLREMTEPSSSLLWGGLGNRHVMFRSNFHQASRISILLLHPRGRRRGSRHGGTFTLRVRWEGCGQVPAT